MRRSVTQFCGTMIVLSVTSSHPATAQNRRTTSEGVFTAAQSSRGKTIFATACTECHGADLISANRPPLKGESFLNHWMEGGLVDLYARVKSMPNRANLGESAYVDVLAFLLDANGFPSGTRELDAIAIPNIQVQGKNGPSPVPNFALVDVVACFARGPHDQWILTKGSEPVRTRSPLKPSEPEIAAARIRTLGSQKFELLDVENFSNAFQPEVHAGHKVNAKGFLIRTGSELRINVTWIEMLEENCDH